MRGSRGSMELSETALKLSKVIEREAKRTSALNTSSLFSVQNPFPSFSRPKTSKTLPKQRSNRVSSVTPAPEESSVKSPEKGSSLQLPSPGKKNGSKKVILRQESKTEVGSMAGDGEEHEGYMQAAWLFFEDPQSSIPAYYYSLGIYGFVVLSTFVFVAETEAVFDPYMTDLTRMEAVCAGVFSFELVSRLLVCPSKIRFLRDYSNWVDFSAVFPYYLESLLAVDGAGSFGAIRIVRLTRVARVLKMSRYSSAIQVFTQAISISIKPLTMLIFLMSIAMIIFSSAIYFAELTNDGCRAGGWMGKCDIESSGVVNTTDVVYSISAAAAVASVSASDACVCVDPNPYQGIATSFWWCIVTMSTVGYGDMTPVTWDGKVVGCVTVLTGMLVLALPITVIGTNFQKVMKSVMHQTMKSNVDYLKGKRMLCRNEIEAILERFHAVTEGIHLDIDDVIAVYDTDNSGMLEDDELAKFRNDLEILQNRAFMNQLVVPGVVLPQHRSPTISRRRSNSVVLQSQTELLLQSKVSHTNSRRSSLTELETMPNRVSRISSRRKSSLTGSFRLLGKIMKDASDSKLTDANATAVVDAAPEQQSGPSADTAGLSPPTQSSSAAHLVMPDNELLLRLLDMQESFQERLIETEQRLETKLNNLTKILRRLESMMEVDE